MKKQVLQGATGAKRAHCLNGQKMDKTDAQTHGRTDGLGWMDKIILICRFAEKN